MWPRAGGSSGREEVMVVRVPERTERARLRLRGPTSGRRLFLVVAATLAESLIWPSKGRLLALLLFTN
jgi:hypothetical protein